MKNVELYLATIGAAGMFLWRPMVILTAIAFLIEPIRRALTW